MSMGKSNRHPGKHLAAPRPVESLIRMIRGQKAMLDVHLAELYGVPTKHLNQAVKRNPKGFPANFMFQLSPEEANTMRSQFVTASKRNFRFQPLAVTEHGVVMLSAVLNSARAVEMSILGVDAFVRMRELVAPNKDTAAGVEKLERGHEPTASVIEVLVEDIDRLAGEV